MRTVGEVGHLVEFFVFSGLASFQGVEVDIQLFERLVPADHADRPAAERRHVSERFQAVELSKRVGEGRVVELAVIEQLAGAEMDHFVPSRADQPLDRLKHATLDFGLLGQQVDQCRQLAIEPHGRPVL